MFDADFDLVGPAELRAAGAELAARFARATGAGRGDPGAPDREPPD
jgi:hypothetical protein